MREDWWSCDGYSCRKDARSAQEELGLKVSRRSVLSCAGLSLLSWLGTRTSLAQLSINPNRDHMRDTLVVLFLRGGADCMSLVVPVGDDAYHRERPSLAFNPPQSLKLDNRFSFNPMLAPMMPLFQEGKLAIVHAVGSDDHTRSHFEAMSAMERGLRNDGNGPSDGWIARHLLSTESSSDSPLRAVALSSVIPNSLRGATHAVALSNITEFRLQMDGLSPRPMEEALKQLYALHDDEISVAGRDTLGVIDALNQLDPSQTKTHNGAIYPQTDLGNAFRQTAMLIRAEIGLEVAALEMGGWDTHVAQGTSNGLIAGLVTNLGQSIAAFAKDLGPRLDRTTIVVMTEFGRRLKENNGFGTDHGRAGAMMVLGGGVQGGKVYTHWPGLEEDNLDEVGDLVVTTDYRNVLSETLTKQMKNERTSAVFPGLDPAPVGLFNT